MAAEGFQEEDVGLVKPGAGEDISVCPWPGKSAPSKLQSSNTGTGNLTLTQTSANIQGAREERVRHSSRILRE